MKYKLWIPGREDSEIPQWIQIIYEDGSPHPEIISIDLKEVLNAYLEAREKEKNYARIL